MTGRPSGVGFLVLGAAVGVAINVVAEGVVAIVGGVFVPGAALRGTSVQFWSVIIGAGALAVVSAAVSGYVAAAIAKREEFLVSAWQGTVSAVSVLIIGWLMGVPAFGFLYVLLMLPGLLMGGWLAKRANVAFHSTVHVPWP